MHGSSDVNTGANAWVITWRDVSTEELMTSCCVTKQPLLCG